MEEEKERRKTRRSSAAENLRRRNDFKYTLIAEGALIGLITGALISVFRLMLTGADRLRGLMVQCLGAAGGAASDEGISAGGAVRAGTELSSAAAPDPAGTAGFFDVLAAMPLPAKAAILAALLLLIAAVVTLLLVAEPDISGSGIPQVEAELRGQKKMSWLRVIVCKMAGCALAVGGGLALGREGPSIQLGAMVGKGFARGRRSLLTEERLLLTCGAGAGLSAAFGAPLAGAIFSLEELHRNFSAEVLITTMAAAAASDFVAANILGLEPVFDITVEQGIPLGYYWAVILLGLILGLFGVVYNRTIAFMQELSEHIGKAFSKLICGIAGRQTSVISDGMHPTGFAARAAAAGRLLTVFAMAYILFFIYPDALGSGGDLVGRIGRGEFAAGSLILLLAVKFIFSTASFGSGAPGGIFLPLLVLGAVTGGAFSELMASLGPGQGYIEGFVVIAMAGYFSAIVRAPVTGVVLITEMTGNFTTLLPLVLASLTAYVTAERLGAKPIYTQLLERSLGHAAGPAIYSGRRPSSLRDRKTVIDADVHVGSRMDGRPVSESGLPLGTLIISVTRGGTEIIPDGHTILRGGDELEILTRENDLADLDHIIEENFRVLDSPGG